MTAVGFTGTQLGMTDSQKKKVIELLNLIEGTEFHHGDCIGADEESDFIAKELGYRIVIHPPTDDKKRAFCTFDEIREPKYYTDRNKDIVDESEIVIATPKGFEEELRSGTWSTVRYAKKKNKVKLIVVYPNGEIE